MSLLFKAAITLAVVLTATVVGRRWPSLGGLLAVMPLSGLLVLILLHVESHGDAATMRGYTRGALFGIIPTALFFTAALIGYRKGWPLSAVLACGFAVWGAAALLHQWWLR